MCLQNCRRAPRSFYDGAQSIINFCQKLEQEWHNDGEDGEKVKQVAMHILQYAFEQINP